MSRLGGQCKYMVIMSYIWSFEIYSKQVIYAHLWYDTHGLPWDYSYSPVTTRGPWWN